MLSFSPIRMDNIYCKELFLNSLSETYKYSGQCLIFWNEQMLEKLMKIPTIIRKGQMCWHFKQNNQVMKHIKEVK